MLDKLISYEYGTGVDDSSSVLLPYSHPLISIFMALD